MQRAHWQRARARCNMPKPDRSWRLFNDVGAACATELLSLSWYCRAVEQLLHAAPAAYDSVGMGQHAVLDAVGTAVVPANVRRRVGHRGRKDLDARLLVGRRRFWV